MLKKYYNIYMLRHIFGLFGSFILLPLYAQVYPYEFRPVKQSSEGRKYGLVNAQNEKVTEPIFGLIDPFLNQEYNDYTLYYTSVANPPGSQYPYHSVKGLLDKTGRVVVDVQDNNLVYDGNGRIAYIPGDSLDTYFNLQTKKRFTRNSDERVVHIARGSTYYMLVFDLEKKVHTVINEHGSTWPVETKPYQGVAYVKTINNMPVYQIETLNRTVLYFDGEGHEVSSEKIYPEEEYEGVDENIPEPESELFSYGKGPTTTLSEESRKGILDKYPDYSIGKPIYEESGGIKFIEIKNQFDKIGLVDLEGNLILECIYTKLTPLLSDFNDDKMDDKFYVEISIYSNSGLMNMNGKILFKPNFGFIQFNERVNLFSLMGPNGYSGFCDAEGHIFLPKECGCIQN